LRVNVASALEPRSRVVPLMVTKTIAKLTLMKRTARNNLVFSLHFLVQAMFVAVLKLPRAPPRMAVVVSQTEVHHAHTILKIKVKCASSAML